MRTVLLAIACFAAALPPIIHGRVANAAQTPQQTPTFVAHPEHIQPGPPLPRPLAQLQNPYEGNAQRIGEGAKLFVSYNCMDCHGADGSGAMAPSLQDSRWHFGGSAGEVFESIYEGRPDGMPAWGGRISDDQIWRLVAYVRSLAKGHQVATENFTGKTVERGGR
jgi:cytochrome c oxidase cbb3-type subunit 3